MYLLIPINFETHGRSFSVCKRACIRKKYLCILLSQYQIIHFSLKVYIESTKRNIQTPTKLYAARAFSASRSKVKEIKSVLKDDPLKSLLLINFNRSYDKDIFAKKYFCLLFTSL